MKILVVEDDPTSLKLAHVVLSAEGHEVTQAEAVYKALEEVLRSKPDVILLDLQLPHIDGLMLARKLKDDPAWKHIVIIAVTAYPELYPREQAMEAGCDAYIQKPFSTQNLTAQVAGVMKNLK